MTAYRSGLAYRCTEQIVRDYGGRRRAYRLNVLDRAGIVVYAINDVCGSSREARALEDYLTRNQVALRHVHDVVEDWVAYR